MITANVSGASTQMAGAQTSCFENRYIGKFFGAFDKNYFKSFSVKENCFLEKTPNSAVEN